MGFLTTLCNAGPKADTFADNSSCATYLVNCQGGTHSKGVRSEPFPSSSAEYAWKHTVVGVLYGAAQRGNETLQPDALLVDHLALPLGGQEYLDMTRERLKVTLTSLMMEIPPSLSTLCRSPDNYSLRFSCSCANVRLTCPAWPKSPFVCTILHRKSQSNHLVKR